MALSRSRVVAIALIVALGLGVGSRAVFASEADARSSTTTLTLVDGRVLVRHGDSDFVAAREGDVLAPGDTVRTESGASAELTYFDGSSVRIDADSETVVASLRADGGFALGVIKMVDRTWRVVTKLLSGYTRYDVRTPSSTASVRG